MVHEIKDKNLLQLSKQSAREIGYKTVAAYALLVVMVIAIGVTFLLSRQRQNIVQNAADTDVWAFEETFDGLNPASPSQDLLPRTFDYSVTHRNHPANQQAAFDRGIPDHWEEYPADHGMDCSPPTAQHPIIWTGHTGNHNNPDKSFFICRNHMMSSMGDVDGYSVSNFWPLQEFDFSQGTGVLEFDVNINTNPGRSWREILIAPREQMRIAPAIDWLPIDETYPHDRIVLALGERASKQIMVGTGEISPDGWIAEIHGPEGMWIFPNDPALQDRAIRRKNRIEITNNKIVWKTQKQDGTFDELSLDIPQGIPFKKGLVMFKTHAYTPHKAENFNMYTYHWDNIRFNGPKLPPYEIFEYSGGIVNLGGNGSVPIGSTQTVNLDLPKVGPNPAIFAQVQQPKKTQVLLSINGNPNIDMTTGMDLNGNCPAGGWTSTRVPINSSQLWVGANTLKWTVGPRPSGCEGAWDGFAVKDLEVQFDGAAASGTIIPTNSPTPILPTQTWTPTPSPQPTATLTPTPTRTPTPIPPTATPSPTPTRTPTPVPPTATSTPQAPTPTKTPAQKADFNNSGKVDIQDLSFLLSKWGTTDTTSDLNNDGKTNTLDLSILLSNWGL